MKQLLIILAILSLLLIAGCNTIKDEILAPVNDTPDAEGYYTSTNNSFVLKYKVEGADLHCILTGNGSGWVSVGFDPTQRMKNANFIIGYVNGGTAYIRDDWGTGETTHEADVDVSGQSNVTLISGTEAGGKTILEFAIPLDSGDSKDKAMAIGSTYHIIFANGNADNFDAMHNSFGVSVITLH